MKRKQNKFEPKMLTHPANTNSLENSHSILQNRYRSMSFSSWKIPCNFFPIQRERFSQIQITFVVRIFRKKIIVHDNMPFELL